MDIFFSYFKPNLSIKLSFLDFDTASF